jgi:nucleoside phosphorylase
LLQLPDFTEDKAPQPTDEHTDQQTSFTTSESYTMSESIDGSEDSTRPPSRDEALPASEDFEVAVICALQIEGNAVEALFDKTWPDAMRVIKKNPGDINTYTVGRIGLSPVVLVWMPEMGKADAVAVAKDLQSTFSKIKYALIVGICGGMPYSDSKEILLGDIIISKGIKKYDCGRQYSDTFSPRGPELGPGPEIGAFLNKLQATSSYKALTETSFQYLLELLKKEEFFNAKYLGPQCDKLYEPTYVHKHHNASICSICTKDRKNTDVVCEEATKSTCTELQCDRSYLVSRDRVEELMADSARARTPKPVIHFGIIASGDTVMKSGKHRDSVAKRDKVIAFETEGAGVFRVFPSVVVIKSVCDYADSHKNKAWQPYAAVTAAACMKAFLQEKERIHGMSGPWQRINENPSKKQQQHTLVDHTQELLEALQKHPLSNAKSLLQNRPSLCIDVTTTTSKGRNMLHLVIGTAIVSSDKSRHDISEIVELLCGRGVDVNAATDRDQLRPIHCCAKTMNTEAAKCLLKHGANINMIDANNRTALDYMTRYPQPDLKLAELLIDRGGNLAKKTSFILPKNATVAQRRLRELLIQKGLIQ